MFGNELLDYLATRYGIDVALDVKNEFGGDQYYIGKKPLKDTVQEFIENNYGKMNTRQIAKATGLSVRAVQIRLNRPISKAQVSLPF
jgi:hypothetical protein